MFSRKTGAERFADQRARMVARQLRRRHIRDEDVLAAMGEVPREYFLPREQRAMAYQDRALPLTGGQTMSQPYMVALMIQGLRLRGAERVLEVGTGSGYQAAVLGRLAARVYTVECHPSLALGARLAMRRLGYRNVHVARADGCHGYAEQAPYQGIVVAAAAPFVPAALQAQLADGGRLVMPVGGTKTQRLTIVTRKGDVFIEEKTVTCRFVPLLGTAEATPAGASVIRPFP